MTSRNDRPGHHYRALITSPEREARGLQPRKTPSSTTPERAKKGVNVREDEWEYVKGWERRKIGPWVRYIMPDDEVQQSPDDDAISDFKMPEAPLIDDSSRTIDASPIESVRALLHAHDMHEGSWCYTCKRNAAPQVGHYIEVMTAADFIK